MKTLFFIVLAAVAGFGLTFAIIDRDLIGIVYLSFACSACCFVGAKSYLNNARAIKIIQSKCK